MPSRQRIASAVFAGLLVVLTVSARAEPTAPAARTPVSIVYPHLEKPYSTVFDAIVEGIETQAPSPLLKQPLMDETQGAGLIKQLNAERVTITLGRRPWLLLKQAGWKGPQVTGGLYITPGKAATSGVSLYLEPRLVADYFQQINPQIRRVILVANPTTAVWFKQRTAILNQAMGLRFEVLETDTRDVVKTARRYWNAAESMDPKTDALWLDHDVDDILVDGLVELAWDQGLTLFSANVMHVERGVLFALIPDAPKLGARLAEIAQATAQFPNAPRQIEPLTAVRLAINLRVANHLRLDVNPPDDTIVFE